MRQDEAEWARHGQGIVTSDVVLTDNSLQRRLEWGCMSEPLPCVTKNNGRLHSDSPRVECAAADHLPTRPNDVGGRTETKDMACNAERVVPHCCSTLLDPARSRALSSERPRRACSQPNCFISDV
jgi:hypothetical protein